MITTAQIQVSPDSPLVVTMSLTVAEWKSMRDDLQSVVTSSVPIAELAMQIDAIVKKAQAQIEG